MKNFSKYALVSLVLVLSTCTAQALAFGGNRGPEIDPGLAVSALTLLGGTLTVLRVRRKK